MCRAATTAEVALLWDAVVQDDYVENASDGGRRWAFLLDFALQGGGDLFVGFSGAIVHVEDNLGPTSATLYTAEEMHVAWTLTFTHPAAVAS
jgi:hypothetical protein